MTFAKSMQPHLWVNNGEIGLVENEFHVYLSKEESSFRDYMYPTMKGNVVISNAGKVALLTRKKP